MKKISAEIVADSVNLRGDRITTMLLTYPRFIHGEVLTHRMFSRNSASSRAIPFEKMIKMVEEDPFIPIAWQKDHKGMQGNEYITDEVDIELNKDGWLRARDNAVASAKYLNHGVKEGRDNGVTKQLCNRLLEPFMWHTVLVTATEWENFFNLRCPQYEFYGQSKGIGLPVQYFKSKTDYCKVAGGNPEEIVTEFWLGKNKSQAEIHIQALAEAMWDAMNESTPNQLKAGEWHIPFGDRIDCVKADIHDEEDFNSIGIKIATARAARLSYMTFDGEIDYEKDIQLHDRLLADGHMSPFEHCARAMSEEEYYSFVKGTIPTQIDECGITNLEMMPVSSGHLIVGFTGLNPTNGDKYGWCNNFRGFIQYRHIIEQTRICQTKQQTTHLAKHLLSVLAFH